MWESLKKLIRSNHDRIVVVEDNEPRYVIIPIQEYTALVEKGRQVDSTEVLQKVNSALQEAHELEPTLPPIVPPEDRHRSGVNIEDLPL